MGSALRVRSMRIPQLRVKHLARAILPRPRMLIAARKEKRSPREPSPNASRQPTLSFMCKIRTSKTFSTPTPSSIMREALPRLHKFSAIMLHLSSRVGTPGALKCERWKSKSPGWCVPGEQSALDRRADRHGHRGAAEIAGTIDHLYALRVLTDAVASRHFELLFEGDPWHAFGAGFLVNANPKAARAIVMRFEERLPAASGRAGGIRRLPALPRCGRHSHDEQGSLAQRLVSPARDGRCQ